MHNYQITKKIKNENIFNKLIKVKNIYELYNELALYKFLINYLKININYFLQNEENQKIPQAISYFNYYSEYY